MFKCTQQLVPGDLIKVFGIDNTTNQVLNHFSRNLGHGHRVLFQSEMFLTITKIEIRSPISTRIFSLERRDPVWSFNDFLFNVINEI